MNCLSPSLALARASLRSGALLVAAALVSFASMADATNAPTDTDLAALRYFSSVGNTQVAEAEMRRLQAQFPDVDIGALSASLTPRAAVDVGPIWQMIDTDRLDAAEALIAATMSATPGWQPSEDMRKTLSMRQGLRKMERAYADKNLAEGLAAAAAHPEILTCDIVNTAWQLTDLMALAGDTTGALAMLQNVVMSCPDPAVVQASLQKAHAAAPDADLSALVAAAKRRHPEMAQTIETLQAAWKSPLQQAKVVNTAVSRAQRAAAQKDWASCIGHLTSQRSADAALQRAWCLQGSGQTASAVTNFEHARAQGTARQRGEASFGLALGQIAQGQLGPAQDLLNTGSMTAPQRATLQRALLSRSAQVNFDRRRNPAALKDLAQLEARFGPLDRGETILKGWILVKSNRQNDGLRVVEALHDKAPGRDTRLAISAMLASR